MEGALRGGARRLTGQKWVELARGLNCSCVGPGVFFHVLALKRPGTYRWGERVSVPHPGVTGVNTCCELLVTQMRFSF